MRYYKCDEDIVLFILWIRLSEIFWSSCEFENNVKSFIHCKKTSKFLKNSVTDGAAFLKRNSHGQQFFILFWSTKSVDWCRCIIQGRIEQNSSGVQLFLDFTRLYFSMLQVTSNGWIVKTVIHHFILQTISNLYKN